MGLEAGTLTAFGLYLLRCSAMVLAAPLFGVYSGFSGFRIALIASLSLSLFLAGGTPLPNDVSAFEFGLLALSELMTGMALGLVLELVLLGVRTSGEMLGHEMGMNMAKITDPTTGVSQPLMTRLYETLFLLGLLAVDGHHWLVRALSDSFRAAPVGRLGGVFVQGEGVWRLVETQFTQMFAAGVTFAAPVMVLLFLVSATIGLLAKAVPQLNLLEAGFTLRILAGLGASLLLAPLLAPAMGRLYDVLFQGLDDAVPVLVGS